MAPQPQAVVDRAMPLSITPAPQTLYRLWLVVEPLARPVAVAAPEVPPLRRRRGFTAVEWGVVIDGSAPVCVPEATRSCR